MRDPQTKMTKKILTIAKYTLVALGLVLFMNQLAFAQPSGSSSTSTAPKSSLILPDVSTYNGMVQDPGITPGTAVPFSSAFASLIVGLVLNVRYVLLAVAIAMIVFAGFNLVTAQGNEEKWKSAKSTLTFAIIGLAVVGLAGEIVRIFAVGNCAELGMLPSGNTTGCTTGGILKTPQQMIQRTTLFNQDVMYLITFLKYMIGAIAVLVLMRSAIRMVTNSAGDELEKDKKNVVACIIGLILIVISDPIVNNIFFSVDKTRYPSVGGAVVGFNYQQGISEVVGFTNYMVTILTPIAILVVVVGGVMYITSGGNAENQAKAKRMIFLAVLGIIIIYGAFAIVSTFIAGSFSSTAAPTTNPAAAVEGSPAAPTTTPPTNG